MVAARIVEKFPIQAADGDLTFAQLRNTKPHTTLYVVTMDLASGQPLVFSPDLTPDASIADAVVASSAIPVAFPAQRFGIDGEVHRLVDGGVWANYPSFVFLDEDFRQWHKPDDGAETRDTIGFVLDSVAPKPVVHPTSKIHAKRQRPWSSDQGSAARELGVLGGLITSPLVRSAAILLPVVVLVLGVSWFDREIKGNLELVGRLPDGFEDLALLILIALFALLVVQSLAFAYTVVRLGTAMTDEGLVGTTAALGVGPSVPYWVGISSSEHAGKPRHIAIRLMVPKALTTLAANPSDKVKTAALEAGRSTTDRKLGEFYGDEGYDQQEPAVFPPPSLPDTRGRFVRFSLNPIVTTIVFWIGFFVVSGLAFSVVRATDESRVGLPQLVILFVAGAAMLVYHGYLRTHRAKSSATWLRRRKRGLVVSTVVLFLVALFFASIAFENAGELSVRQRLTASTTNGDIIAERTPTGAFDDAYALDVVVDEPLPFFSDDGETFLYVDLEGDDIKSCDDNDVGRCVTMLTDHEFADGERPVVRYDAGQGVVFFQADRWSLPGYGAMYPVLATWFLIMSLAMWRARQWQRDNRPPASAPVGSSPTDAG